MLDSAKARRPIAFHKARTMGVAPSEERRIVDQSVFDDLGIAGAELAIVERVQQFGVGENEQRMMERPNQVLLASAVNCRLAADGAVGLRQQGRRDVQDRATALEQRGG